MDEIISFQNVTFAFDNETILENIHFSICKNDFIGIIGPNGGGKTTLLRLMLGTLKPNKGEVRIFNQAAIKSRQYIGYVPQFSKLDDDFPITVEQVVAMGLFKNSCFFPYISKKKLIQIHSALEKVKILNLAKKNFGELSGGQKQRCLLARAIAALPEILLLDEPTASVDSSVEKDIYDLLRSLNKKMTIILVSHDLGFISAYIKRVFCVNRQLADHCADQISEETSIDVAYEKNKKMIQHQCQL